ncbi:hypothetical protein ACFY0P_46010 [Streptomyces sp. NPDC001714]|uniref:hypothetical protein n=1 Tax=Streptomyces sp. NPDC001714 TaxID=3364603 RepID=UPI0036818509
MRPQQGYALFQAPISLVAMINIFRGGPPSAVYAFGMHGKETLMDDPDPDQLVARDARLEASRP